MVSSQEHKAGRLGMEENSGRPLRMTYGAMAYRSIALLCGFFLALVTSSSASDRPYLEVKFVYDGDTILLSNGEKVRYLGIDSPEIDHEGGKSDPLAWDARRVNLEILKKHQVRLEFDIEKRDRYDRLLAYVFMDDGRLISELMVLKGYAHVLRIKPNFKYWERLLVAQRKAMKEGVGIWGLKIKEDPAGYIGNVESFVFHRKDCRFGKQTSVKNSRLFKKRNEAFFQGFSPCRRCKP
jgi:endonuclease YncB( thermonuclease family)